MFWLKRWNFIERAKLERQLWDAFEQREDLEAKVKALREMVESGTSTDLAEDRFRLEVWSTTLERIRKIEVMMKDQQR
ncbi:MULTISPECIES: hypothetical protein [unclassified Synechococcus]|jgi:hypothetical protein|uniref:hypothetical protein n=1 Tax=unclassified Synechococcus TaxID=2626047 RepID=UPI000C93230F|nr:MULTISPECIES: hypothetical protein [unclassified Synechococcus]MAS27864.1 hypothetical protein [Synechococcus sp. NAT40]RZO11234.1 MAG: hypothetical protein EVB08_09470 [Synechococcus sp. MED-G135]|tara:strand:+ start:492 stop:725 length:234 start_codon:yes stop_codon:yes gene_type:complete